MCHVGRVLVYLLPLFLCSPLSGELPAAPTRAQTEALRLNNIGTALMNQQLLEKAIDKFDEARKLDPSLTAAELNKGIALLYLQRLPEAATALEHAAAQAPNDPRVWYATGLLYRSDNKPHESMTAFQKVLRLDPSNADSHYFLGSFLLDQQNLPAAEAEFRAALKLAPLHASAQFRTRTHASASGEGGGGTSHFETLSTIDKREACFSVLTQLRRRGGFGKSGRRGRKCASSWTDDPGYVFARVGKSE